MTTLMGVFYVRQNKNHPYKTGPRPCGGTPAGLAGISALLKLFVIFERFIDDLGERIDAGVRFNLFAVDQEGRG